MERIKQIRLKALKYYSTHLIGLETKNRNVRLLRKVILTDFPGVNYLQGLVRKDIITPEQYREYVKEIIQAVEQDLTLPTFIICVPPQFAIVDFERKKICLYDKPDEDRCKENEA